MQGESTVLPSYMGDHVKILDEDFVKGKMCPLSTELQKVQVRCNAGTDSTWDLQAATGEAENH